MKITPRYVAGFFDGEGCIRLRRAMSHQREHIRVELAIYNTNLLVLTMIQQEYGGKILKRQNKHRPVYCLYWSNLESVKGFLSIIKPHLIIKQRHAELLSGYLDAHASNRRIRLTEQDWNLVEQMSHLNLELRYRAPALAGGI